MVNGTLLNFGKRYEDNLRVIFEKWPKLHLGLDALLHKQSKNLESYLIFTQSNIFKYLVYICLYNLPGQESL